MHTCVHTHSHMVHHIMHLLSCVYIHYHTHARKRVNWPTHMHTMLWDMDKCVHTWLPTLCNWYHVYIEYHRHGPKHALLHTHCNMVDLHVHYTRKCALTRMHLNVSLDQPTCSHTHIHIGFHNLTCSRNICIVVALHIYTHNVSWALIMHNVHTMHTPKTMHAYVLFFNCSGRSAGTITV